MIRKPFKPPLLKRPSPQSEHPHKKARSNDAQASLVDHRVKTFQHPRKPLQNLHNDSSNDRISDTSSKSSGVEGYYTVLWRKFTTKKHKTWDGDGVLSVSNGYAILQDISGRDLGKSKWNAPLIPGSTLSVGGKDVEVDTVISKQDFLAGKPFLGGVFPKTEPVIKRNPSGNLSLGFKKVTPRVSGHFVDIHTKVERNPPLMTKSAHTGFKKPAMKNSAQRSNVSAGRPIPRHDPSAPNALIMTRTEYIPKGKQIVDVVVDPILSKHLRDHQREGVKFLYECVMGLRTSGEGAILADEMGLGKTLQTIALLWTLLKQNPISGDPPVIKKALIVCPATLINNWRKEFRKWLGVDRIGVFVVDEKRKTNITDFTMGNIYNVMIVGYEKLRNIQEDLQKGPGIDIVIADEGHRLKTAQNKSAQAIKSLNTERRIVLSGTPIQNNLSEFYVTVDFVNPGLLGKYNTFKKNFEGPIIKSRQPDARAQEVEVGEARWEELSKLTSQFILRRTADIIAKYLPPKVETILFCRPTTVQASIYRAVLESPIFSAVIGSPENSLQLIDVLKKLCNSPSLLLKRATEENPTETIASLLSCIPSHLLNPSPSASTKLQVLDSLLHHLSDNTDEKVVIVSNYTSSLDMIARLLTALSYPFLRLDGNVAATKRQSLVDEFNRTPCSKVFAFLLSAKAGGTGLNLIGASRLVLFDLDWNPATDLQAMARIHRDGQRRPCYIYRLLVAGALDEKIFQRQVAKTGLADAVVDAKRTAQGFSAQELRDLFRLEEEACPTHDLLACSCGGKGNTRVLPESGVDNVIDLTAEEDIPDFMEDDDEDADMPEIGELIRASRVNMAKQERKVQKILKESWKSAVEGNAEKRSEQNMLTLMQYLHIDVRKLRDIEPCSEEHEDAEQLESLVEDDILLNVLKEKECRVDFVFARTSGVDKK